LVLKAAQLVRDPAISHKQAPCYRSCYRSSVTIPETPA